MAESSRASEKMGLELRLFYQLQSRCFTSKAVWQFTSNWCFVGKPVSLHPFFHLDVLLSYISVTHRFLFSASVLFSHVAALSLSALSPPSLVFPFSPTSQRVSIVESALYNNLTLLIHSHPSRENPIASSSVCPTALRTVDSSKHR